MTNTVREIVLKVLCVDDGGLDIIKRVMKDVLGDVPEDTWSDVMDQVLTVVGDGSEFRKDVI